jgi:hypothetical protein
MANFLNRMAARAVGAARIAQPYVPARFTPGAGLVRNDAPAHAGLETEVEGVEATARPATQAPSGSPRDATLPVEIDVSSSRAVSRNASMASPADSLPAPPTPAVVEPLARAPFSTATLAVTEPLPAPAALEVSSYLGPGAIRPLAFERPATTSLEADGKLLQENDKIYAGEPARPVATALRFTQGMPVNSRTMGARRDQAYAAEPPAPVIRVSIGRIDVRAQFTAATPSPTPARNARPAALSLDEYLKQRSEGKR